MSPRKLLLTVDRSVNAVAFPFSVEVRTATTHFFADPYVAKNKHMFWWYYIPEWQNLQ